MDMNNDNKRGGKNLSERHFLGSSSTSSCDECDPRDRKDAMRSTITLPNDRGLPVRLLLAHLRSVPEETTAITTQIVKISTSFSPPKFV